MAGIDYLTIALVITMLRLRTKGLDLHRLLHCFEVLILQGTLTQPGLSYGPAKIVKYVVQYHQVCDQCYDSTPISDIDNKATIPKSLGRYICGGFCIVVPRIGKWKQHAKQLLSSKQEGAENKECNTMILALRELRLLARNKGLDIHRVLHCLEKFARNNTFVDTGYPFDVDEIVTHVIIYYCSCDLCYDIVPIDEFDSSVPGNCRYYEHNGYCVVVPNIGKWELHAKQVISNHIASLN